MEPRPTPSAVPGSQARAYLLRMQRRFALVTVVVPALGLVAGGALVAAHRLGVIQLAILAVMYSVSMIGACVGYHRLFTHRSFQTRVPVRIALAVMGAMAGQGPLIFWVATHRKHHQYSDEEGDPHSPHNGQGFWRGLWHAHIGWMFSSDPADPLRYAPDLLKDRLLLRIDRSYMVLLLSGLLLPTAAGVLFIGGVAGAIDGFVWGGLVRIFLAQHVTWSVNSICHVTGSMPHPTRDQSRNVAWLAVPTFGEGWHNNHHAFPSAAFHGMRWFQIDLSALVIRTLCTLRLADHVVRPKERANAS